MKKSLITEAVAISRSKNDLHPEYGRFCHFSFVIQNNKIIEYGGNHSGQPRIHYGYNKKVRSKSWRPKTHAEASAYFKARGLLEKNKFFEIINIRLSKQGELRNSKPCDCCAEFLTALGCRCFYFSSSNNSFLKERY